MIAEVETKHGYVTVEGKVACWHCGRCDAVQTTTTRGEIPDWCKRAYGFDMIHEQHGWRYTVDHGITCASCTRIVAPWTLLPPGREREKMERARSGGMNIKLGRTRKRDARVVVSATANYRSKGVKK